MQKENNERQRRGQPRNAERPVLWGRRCEEPLPDCVSAGRALLIHGPTEDPGSGASVQEWETEAEAVECWSQALNSTSGGEGQEHRPWSPFLSGLDSWLHCILTVILGQLLNLSGFCFHLYEMG